MNEQFMRMMSSMLSQTKNNIPTINGMPFDCGTFTPNSDFNSAQRFETIQHKDIGETRAIFIWTDNPNPNEYSYGVNGYAFSGVWFKTTPALSDGSLRMSFYRTSPYGSGTNALIDAITNQSFRVKGASYGILKQGVTYNWLAIGTQSSGGGY